MDGPAPLRHCIRGLLQGLHRGPHARPHPRVPPARRRVPHSLRFSIDSLQHALEAIDNESGKSRAEPLRRLSGRLQAMLSYSSVDEILTGDVVAYLRGIQIECCAIHQAIYNLYIDYSVQAALAG